MYAPSNDVIALMSQQGAIIYTSGSNSRGFGSELPPTISLLLPNGIAKFSNVRVIGWFDVTT